MVKIKEQNLTPEFEHIPLEVEQTFIPLFPERLAEYRDQVATIRQHYLSGINEPCDLRLREIVEPDGTIHYQAGIKGNERMSPEGRVRDELIDGIAVPKELFDYYAASEDLPVEYKLRAQVNANVVIDFTEDGVSIETEHAIARDAFFDRAGGAGQFMEVTGDTAFKSRWRAEKHYRQARGGYESFKPVPEFSSDAAVAEILHARMNAVQPLVIAISGRSGSGKSTVIRELRDKLAEVGLTSDVTSSDDYHRGKTWLEQYNNGESWQRWDDEIVYNLRALAEDLTTYKEGGVIPRLHMDFVSQEHSVNGVIRQVDVLLVEGIYAGSLELSQLTNLEFELPTPFATCVWRRMLRDAKERPEFNDFEKSFRYILEQVEPAYRAQKAKRAAAAQQQNS